MGVSILADVVFAKDLKTISHLLLCPVCPSFAHSQIICTSPRLGALFLFRW